jgi:hypothetical protein
MVSSTQRRSVLLGRACWVLLLRYISLNCFEIINFSYHLLDTFTLSVDPISYNEMVTNIQRRFRDTRQKMMDNMLNTFHSLVIGDPHAPQNFREVFRDEMFRVTLIEVI